MARRRYRTTTVSVDVDLDVVLGDIETDDLIEELNSRNSATSISGALGSDWVDRLRFYLDRGDIHGAQAMLVSEEVQALVSSESRASQYREAMKD